MNTQQINQLREKYQTQKMTTYTELQNLRQKIGDRKWGEIITADQLLIYRKGKAQQMAEDNKTFLEA